MRGDNQMNTNDEKLEFKGISSIQRRGLSSEEGKQIKDKSKDTRRPKSGRSL